MCKVQTLNQDFKIKTLNKNFKIKTKIETPCIVLNGPVE